MILIKDRHFPCLIESKSCTTGKYDTYKGSTRCAIIAFALYRSSGKYDTYKGSTLTSSRCNRCAKTREI